jgi:hypothetical protein
VVGSRPNRSAGVAISGQDGQDNPKGRPGTGRMGSAWPLVTHMPSGLPDLTKAICTTTQEQKLHDTRLGAVGYALTRSPAAADRSMAAMTWWRRTASAKSGTVWVPLSMSAANAA